MKENFSTTIYLLLLISLGYVATDIYLPSLPALATYFQASENQVQMTLFSYLLSFSLAPLIFGPLSDHYGRKKVILSGVVFSLLATLAAIFAYNIECLIFLRFIQGIGTGAVMIASRASVADIFTGKALTRQTSFMTMLMPLVLSIAPTVGGALQESYQWQTVFIFLAVLMAILLVWVIFKPESFKKTSDKELSKIFSSYSFHFKNRLFLMFSLNYILPSIGFFAYMTVSPFLYQEIIGLSPFEYGSLALLIGATILVTGYLNLKLIQYYSVTHILYIGAGLSVISGSMLIGFYLMNILNTWSLIIPTLIFFACVPLSSANGLSKSLSFVRENFGAATALLTFSQLLTGAFTSFLFSMISNETSLALGVCFLVVGILSILNLIRAKETEKTLEPSTIIS